MNGKEFATRVHSDLTENGIKISKHLTTTVVNCVFNTIKNVMKEESEIVIFKFGKFFTSLMPERICRNPSTGEPMKVEARNRAKIKFSVDLKKFLNS